MGTIHLVRHGQASFGTDDYDRLSELGFAQSAALGTAWEAGGAVFSDAIAGSLTRHAQTAIAAIDASGLGEEDADPGLSGYDVDDRWNEYDHLGLVASQSGDSAGLTASEFQAVLNSAIADWQVGRGDFTETYVQFRDRVLGAFEAAVDVAKERGRRVLVFTSGGPIAMVVSQLVAGSDSAFARLNDVLVNSSATTVMVGSTGPRILTFNDHSHLPASDITFR